MYLIFVSCMVPYSKDLFGVLIYPEAIIGAFPDNPDNAILGVTKKPLPFFIGHGIFFVLKELTQLFTSFQTKRLKPVASLPFT